MTDVSPTASGEGRLWIITPVLLDVTAFLELRRRLHAEIEGPLPVAISEVRFVVVDDSAGADLEMDVVHGLVDVKVVTPPFNLGHQRAIVFGLRTVAGDLQDHDYVVTLDADGEDRPEDVARLLAGLDEAERRLETVALAFRTRRTESLRFRLMYTAFRLLFRTLTGTRIRTGNFAAQRGWFIRHALFHPSFDLCYSTTLLALRRPVVFVPCERGSRYAGESRMRTYGLVAHGVRMLLPFAEQIAVRVLTFSLVCAAGSIAAGIMLVVLLLAGSSGAGAFAVATLGGLVLAVVAFTSFLSLFSGFAHSSALGMQGLDGSRS